MVFEKPTVGKNLEECGVQEVKIENNYYVVSIIWKDGTKSVKHFPTNGFIVANPKTNQNLGFISGKNAVSILKEHSSKYNREDFSWIPFVNK
jgi:hypothetical protein